MPLSFLFFPFLPLPLLVWLLAQPQRYHFQPFWSLSVPDFLAGPLFLALPLGLFLALLWNSPRWRWIWLVLLVPYGFLGQALARAEGWLGGPGLDSHPLPLWGTLSLFRTPQELYLIGRSWLLGHHPSVSSATADTAQVMLTNGCWESRTLGELHSNLEIISSILAGLESLPPSLPALWWVSGIPLLASTFAFVDWLIFYDFPSDPQFRVGSRLLWLVSSIFLFYGLPEFISPASETVAELVFLGDWLAPTLPGRVV